MFDFGVSAFHALGRSKSIEPAPGSGAGAVCEADMSTAGVWDGIEGAPPASDVAAGAEGAAAGAVALVCAVVGLATSGGGGGLRSQAQRTQRVSGSRENLRAWRVISSSSDFAAERITARSRGRAPSSPQGEPALPALESLSEALGGWCL